MELSNRTIFDQRQTLSQSHIQSLSILAMNNQELNVFLQNEFFDNPMFECTNAFEQTNGMTESRNSYEEHAVSNDKNYKYDDDDFQVDKDILDNLTSDIRDHIMIQLYHKPLTNDEWNLIEILIDCLDKNGYFTLKPKEVSEFSGYSESLVIKCLNDLKDLEPVGIFSENLSECLLKQMKASGLTDKELVLIVRDYLPEIIKGRINVVSQEIGISEQKMRRYILEIGKLNPRPCSIFSKSESEYIIPDVIVKFCDGQFVIELNDKNLNGYKYNDSYIRLMRISSDIELSKYLNKNFERCKFIFNCIEQRKKTLLKIVHIITEYQREHFLVKQRLKPMTLADIAIRSGFHSSTVSRAIKGKYIQYKFGTVSMKSLILSYKTEENGQQVSFEKVRDLIKDVVDSECKHNPLSDFEILKEINAKGVKVSRRTIAKHRNDLGISSSHQRRYGV